MDATVFRFFHRLRVRWAECDMQGIVFNPNYMMYFDVAFTEYMRTLGLPYPSAFMAAGTDTFMVTATVNFRDSARYDDEIDIGVRTSYIGTTSFRMAFAMRRNAALLVDGSAVYVNGDRISRAPRPLPGQFVNLVEGFEPAAPARKAESGNREQTA